jgi:hypothetical protein
MTTHLTKNTKTVLRYYLSLDKARFRLSLDTIALASGVKKRTVRRANDRLQDLGVISWISGHGNIRAGGADCTPDEYLINPEATRTHKRQQRRKTAVAVVAVAGTVGQ